MSPACADAFVGFIALSGLALALVVAVAWVRWAADRAIDETMPGGGE